MLSLLSKRWPKLLVLICALALAQARFTDADFVVVKRISDHLFRATTLFFTSRSTSTLAPSNTLFNIDGMIAGGFEMASVRILNEGEMDFRYRVRSRATVPSALCDELELGFFTRDLQPITTNRIGSTSISSQVGEEFSDLVLMLSRDEGGSGDGGGDNEGGGNANGQRCDFEIAIETITDQGETEVGFWHKKVLSNYVTSN